MKYISTRSKQIPVSSAQAIIQGIADDGGLFIPQVIPTLPDDFLKELLPCSYQERAVKILSLYLTDYSESEIRSCVNKAYTRQKFDTPKIAPLTKLSDNQYMLELWHGPTSAFKDMALQLLPQLMSLALKKTKQQRDIIILVATSGDTGKAALAGFSDVARTKIVVFYPKGGVSKMQWRQMASQTGDNVAVFAIDGNFDDAQTGVKNIFNDKELNAQINNCGYILSSANSINLGRLLPQIVYYFSAYCDLINEKSVTIGDKVNFAVPTGNFGDILAGFYAKKMGLPVGRLICASNSNNVLTDFFQTGIYNKNRPFQKTVSPSMDILISSNLERFLYHLTEDSSKITDWMQKLYVDGRYQVDSSYLQQLKKLFSADWVDENNTLKAIKTIYDSYEYTADPHTAVAWQAAQNYKKQSNDKVPLIVLSTASPYKFNGTVTKTLHLSADTIDEFALLDLLHQHSKMPVPTNLAALKKSKILHKNSCQIVQMAEVVKNICKDT